MCILFVLMTLYWWKVSSNYNNIIDSSGSKLNVVGAMVEILKVIFFIIGIVYLK